jgi:D-serine deaminase-like pyridoxal phosphate-dependent protein
LTVATVLQAATVAAGGHRDVLLANEVISDPDLRLLSHWLDRCPDVTVSVLVDSPTGVRALSRSFATAGRGLRVMIGVAS